MNAEIDKLKSQLATYSKSEVKSWGEIKEERMPKYHLEEDDIYIRIISDEQDKFLLTHRQFDKTKGNRGWVDKDMPMVLVQIENVPYMTYYSRL